MNPERWQDQAPLYVLDELPLDARLAFETELERNPALQEEVRDCTDTFGAIAAESAVALPLPHRVWVSLRQRVESLPPTPHHGRSRQPLPLRPGRRLVWPIAAALLLSLNVWQWTVWGPGTTSFATRAEARGPAAEARTGVAAAESTSDAHERNRAAEAIAAESGSAASAEPSPVETVGYWRDRYHALAADHVTFVETIAPIVTSALARARQEAENPPAEEQNQMDQAFAAALWHRAQALLADAGLAVLPDRWRLPGGYIFNPNATLVVSSGETMFARETPGTVPPPPPYAFGLLNHAEGLGFLDLNHVPPIPPQQQLQLWLREVDGSSYVPVGAVPPSLGGGSGAVVFRIPPEVGATAEFIITVEPTTPPVQPTGPIVIRGP